MAVLRLEGKLPELKPSHSTYEALRGVISSQLELEALEPIIASERSKARIKKRLEEGLYELRVDLTIDGYFQVRADIRANGPAALIDTREYIEDFCKGENKAQYLLLEAGRRNKVFLDHLRRIHGIIPYKEDESPKQPREDTYLLMRKRIEMRLRGEHLFLSDKRRIRQALDKGHGDPAKIRREFSLARFFRYQNLVLSIGPEAGIETYDDPLSTYVELEKEFFDRLPVYHRWRVG